MQSVKPIQITFRHLTPSRELTELAQRTAEHLLARRSPVISVRVALELPHRRHRKGTPVRASVELGVPGRTLVARARHVDARAALHEAFDAAERALRSYRGRRRTARQRDWLPLAASGSI